ncbi:hypothetical protein HIM_03810 [Hirsutella minnesotensis 3608]|uniref:Small ribosomal subunit protein uS7m n=1 Tax=Hirsutella minnesotensis 3608 TaxID=1043627 RepID=A0A0F7ZVN7_9HYPO|nr:hypothetical protein HIM_03810 [Hirsutella minnesotensis 3608]
MSPGWRVLGVCRTLALRTRPALQPRSDAFVHARGAPRWYSDDVKGPPSKPDVVGPATRISPSELPAERDTELPPVEDAESAEVDEVEEPPSMVDDSESFINAIDDETLEQMLYGGRVARSGVEGGLTPAQEDTLYREGAIPPAEDVEALDLELQATESSTQLAKTNPGQLENLGHKFGLPPKTYPPGFNLKQRYHPVLEQISRLLMRDGKLAAAQRNLAMAMNFLRTSPAPIYSPKFPLLPGTPPASHLPLNPVLYLTIAIDSVAPLVNIRMVAGAAGGGRALEVPEPLAVRQRRRTAFKWILDVIDKKPSKGSGRKQFPHRIAEEIIAVVEGRSSVWEKRKAVHKLGTSARANVDSFKLKGKGKF